MPIKLPQTPMLTGANEPFYPLTHASQVIKTDGSRLEQDGKINADTAVTSDNSGKLGGKAPEYYVQPVNLLDNSDFTNPVNQRGANNYTGMGYGIDRWVCTSGSTFTTSLDSNGVALSLIEDVTIIWGQFISLDKNKWLCGKTLTFALCDSNDKIHIAIGTVPTSLDAHLDSPHTSINDGNFRCNLYKAHNSHNLFARLHATRITTTPFIIKWAALYEGTYTAETLPPYRPKGYAAELAECMRHYRTNSKSAGQPHELAIGVAYFRPGTAFQGPAISFDSPMRVPPTVSIYNPTNGKQGSVRVFNAPDQHVDDCGISHISEYGFNINSNASAFTPGELYIFYYVASSDL